jgi:glycosyltransferase involved in cell wall biosynthesis
MRPQRLRICHLAKFYPPARGGIETHVQTLARAQAALGAHVSVICVNHDSAGVDVTWRAFAATPTVKETDGEVQVLRVGRRASVSRLDVCPSLPGALLRLRNEGTDIVHVHAPNPTMFVALAMLPAFGTLVVTHHSDVIKQRLLLRAYTPLERLIHARAALVLSDSEKYIEGSQPLLRLGAKVKTLPLGLDLTPFTSSSPEARHFADMLRREHGKPLWLSVGRVVYYKGLLNALDALRSVPGKLLIVGRGPLEDDLRRRAAELGLTERLVFMGNLGADELVGAYQAATGLWFPSNERSEGFGLSQVEAMGSGCPVINTWVPSSGVSWVSLDGVSGLTVPINDARALAAAANRLLDDEFRAKLAAGARKRAQEEFDHRVMADRSLELYTQALDGRDAASAVVEASGARAASLRF